jgi:hypothetical protein
MFAEPVHVICARIIPTGPSPGRIACEILPGRCHDHGQSKSERFFPDPNAIPTMFGLRKGHWQTLHLNRRYFDAFSFKSQ